MRVLFKVALRLTRSSGRSIRQCQNAFQEFLAFYPPPFQPAASLPTPVLYTAPEIARKRPHQQETSTPTGRLLQPRPPHTYPTDIISGPSYTALAPAGEPANKKKRGRPTKAEAQARAEQAAARGEVYPPPRKGKQRSSLSAIESVPMQEAPRQETPGPPPTAVMAASTPQASAVEVGSESSSGKKRRARPQRLELGGHTGAEGLREVESPSRIGIPLAEGSRGPLFPQATPTSAGPSTSSEQRDREMRMEGIEESQPRTTTPRSFRDTVGI